VLPEPAEIDPAAAHAAALRPAPLDRPWVLVNMVASVDGATAVDGVSGDLGGPDDKAVFSAIRSVADVILVGAGTVRAEGYGPPRTTAQRRGERVARGQAPFPRLAVVSRSLDLDPTAAMFGDAAEHPIVFTVADAPADRRTALERVAEVVAIGDHDVDLGAVLVDLHGRGVGVVLGEGGPSLNGQLVAANLVDELDMTLAPTLLGGHSARLAHGAVPVARQAMALAHLWEADGVLFARYVRR
jgi:riboflavin-specific deaminase-like protein